MVALDNTLGALFIGVIVAASLYGVTCVQTWYYFTNYPSDAWRLKLLVLVVLVLDTCHQVLITLLIYIYTITNFGMFQEIGTMHWTLIAEVYLNGFTTLVVQCFLTWRVYKLSDRNLLAVISAMVLVIAELLVVLVFCGIAIPYKTYAQLRPLRGLSMAINGTAAAGDIYIAALLCYLLLRSRTGFRRSDTLVRKLVVFSINTGLLTSFCALASLVCYSVWPNTFVYVAFYFNIGRLYCNSLLATLNARKRLRGEDEDEDDLSLSYIARMTDTAMLGTSSSRHMPNNITIKIDTVREHLQDEHFSSSGDVKGSDAFLTHRI